MFDSLKDGEDSGQKTGTSAIPLDFWILGVVTIVGALAFWGVVRPSPPVVGAGGPVMMVIGAYFVVCSTFAPDFVLYRLKIQRAIDWYGEAFTHVAYRVLGFAALAGGIVFSLSSALG